MTRTLVAFDLELTGLDPQRDEIIEIGAVKFEGDREVARFQSLVKPRQGLSLNIARFTGIAPADLDRSPRFDEVRESLRAFIGDAELVGQSVARDVEALARQGLALGNTTFDTFDLASILLPDLPSYSLAGLAERLGVFAGGAHRALHDALISKGVFLALVERLRMLNPAVVAEMATLAAGVDWPLRAVFADVDRENARLAASSSVAAAIAARGLELFEADFLVRGPERAQPLEPNDDAPRPDLLAAVEAFAPGGAVDASLAGFEHRPQQLEMARAVATALGQDNHLMVEAGTGTGKSLAYLLPAAVLSRETGDRVIVSTATLTLQDQIVEGDLPKVRAILGDEASATWRTAVVKGRTNYLCLRRWSEIRRAAIGASLDEVRLLCRLLVWLPWTETGDRGELNLSNGEQSVWSRLSAQTDDCLNNTCSFQRKGSCFLYRARRAAQSAHLVVVNHSLLLSDLAMDNALLPPYTRLVVDEAHHLEEEATRQFGFEVGRRDLALAADSLADLRGRGLAATVRGMAAEADIGDGQRSAIDDASAGAAEAANALRPLAERLLLAVGRFVRSANAESEGRRRLTASAREDPAWIVVLNEWDSTRTALAVMGERISRLRGAFGALAPLGLEKFEDVQLEVTAQERDCQRLLEQIHSIVAEPPEGFVCWVEASGDDLGSLHAAPLDVADLLERRLFGEKASVVLTSATLATAGEFSYTRTRLGLDRHTRQLAVGSPFDYERNALVLAPSDDAIPEPNRPGHDAAIGQALADIALASNGRLLALFTSHAALRRARGVIRPILERRGIAALGQNVDGPRGQLLASFRANPQSVLLGAASFWEGVDIPGDALSVLVIARLPFGVPTDPVFAARSEQFDDPFNEFAVPQAILRFRQGFGRLIRSASDRGVVVVLDTRMRTKRYGAAFRDSLPRETTFVPARNLAASVREFLAAR